jgi:magnesium transporter
MADSLSTTEDDLAVSRSTGRTPRDGERHAPDAERRDGRSAFLYDADGEDREVVLDQSLIDGLQDDDLLWVDLRMPEREALGVLNGLFATAMKPFSASEEAPRPAIGDYGEYFVLRVLPLRSGYARQDAEALTCAMGRNWLATVHDGDVASLGHFSDHLRGDSVMGRLDAPSFLARLLEWVVNAYFDELDRLQGAIDDLEETILKERGGPAVIERLVALRRDVGRLRRRLSPHRQVFATLSHPSFDVISGSSAAREFAILSDRLGVALETADTTREMVVGAFDVFMTQTAQRTNDVMRILTIVSLLLLPAGVIAGTLGMNMLPGYLLHSWVFWAALTGMVVVSGGLLLIMRLRRWLESLAPLSDRDPAVCIRVTPERWSVRRAASPVDDESLQRTHEAP